MDTSHADTSLKHDLPLISEEEPETLAQTLRNSIAKTLHLSSSKTSENTPPLISEIPPEELEAKWPKKFSDDLVFTLDELFNDKGFVDYLLKSNTFFHGKIGFYKHLIDKLSEAKEIPLNEDSYIHTQDGLDAIKLPAQNSHPLVLMPITESNNAFNTLVAKSLDKSFPLWLIAHPLTIHSHLLVAFHNFCIASSSRVELEHFQYIFRLSDSTVEMLENGTYKGIIVTDYRHLVPKTHSQTAVILRIKKL